MFIADKTASDVKIGLNNLMQGGRSRNATLGIFTGGDFQSSDSNSLGGNKGYKGVSFGLSTPGLNVNYQRNYTSGIIINLNH